MINILLYTLSNNVLNTGTKEDNTCRPCHKTYKILSKPTNDIAKQVSVTTSVVLGGVIYSNVTMNLSSASTVFQR